MRCLRLRKLALTSTAEIAQSMLKQRKIRSPAPIFFPFLHHRRQVFPLLLQNCRIPENKRKKGYPPLPFRYVQALPSLSMLGREFACRKLTALTGCQWFTEESSLQCKLEVQECTGRTFLNDDILGGSECVPPCTRLNFEFASQIRS